MVYAAYRRGTRHAVSFPRQALHAALLDYPGELEFLGAAEPHSLTAALDRLEESPDLISPHDLERARDQWRVLEPIASSREAFERAYHRWDEVAAMARPDLWVQRVALNLATSRLRRVAAEARAVARVGSGGVAAVAATAAFEDAESFWRLVRRLPRQQARIVALHYAADRSVAEVAEVLLIDTSESMGACHCAEGPIGLSDEGGVNKTTISKAAAVRAVDALSANDEIGILAFSGSRNWIVPLQQLPSSQVIEEAVSSLRPFGDTQIVPALREAADDRAAFSR